MFKADFPPQQKSSEGAKETILGKFRKIPVAKKIALLAMLNLGRIGEAKANEGEPKKIEYEAEKEVGKSSEKTYQMESEKTAEGGFLYKIENKFETDKITVSKENEAGIQKEIEKILENISPENIKKILNSEIIIEASADPDPSDFSGEHGEGNIGLARGRGEILKQQYEKVKNNFDFEKNGIPKGQVERFKSMPIKVVIPEDGVRKLTEVINEKTGKHYTEEELALMSEEEKESVVKPLARVATISFVERATKTREGTIEDIFEQTKNKERVFVYFDNSNSMIDNGKQIEEVRKTKGRKNVFYGTFSNVLDKTLVSAETSQGRVVDGKGDSNERIFNAAESAVKMMKEKGDQAMIFVTDEALQGGSIVQIENIINEAEEKNIVVTFAMVGNTGEVLYLDMYEILSFARQKYTDQRKEEVRILQNEMAVYQEKIKNLPQTNPERVEYETLIRKNQNRIGELYSISKTELEKWTGV